jgi:tetratricopeptide (TPR) repeat protein
MAVNQSAPGVRRRAEIFLGAAVFALAVVVFLPIRDHAWLNYDDNVYVTQSAPVLSGMSFGGVRWAFSSFDGANWFPITRLSWLLDAEIHGLDAGAFLTTNLLLHALASLALFLALTRLTGSAPRSACVAALFAVHPLHVESVAWVAARKDPLAGLFFALALLVYARQTAHGATTATRSGLFACTALGLMAKPIVVSLPFVLLLLDAWPLGRFRGGDGPRRAGAAVGWEPQKLRAAVVEKWPLFALVAAASAVTVLAQGSGGTIASLEQVSLPDRLGNAALSYVAYLGKAFWPTGLAVFYPHTAGGHGAGGVAIAAALLIGISIAAWQQRRTRPYLGVGWLWYLVTLVPVIGIVQVGSQAMADRYTYLPLIGIALALVWGIADVCARLPGWGKLPVVIATLVIALLAATAAAQVRHWRDSEALFRHALAVTRDNHVAHSYLGTALLARGDTAAAIDHYREALRLRPDLLTVANNLAWLLATGNDAALRHPIAAIEAAEQAALLTDRRDPAVLDTLAAAYASAGRFEDARQTARRAIELAKERGDAALVAEISERLDRYRAGRPYVEAAP